MKKRLADKPISYSDLIELFRGADENRKALELGAAMLQETESEADAIREQARAHKLHDKADEIDATLRHAKTRYALIRMKQEATEKSLLKIALKSAPGYGLCDMLSHVLTKKFSEKLSLTHADSVEWFLEELAAAPTSRGAQVRFCMVYFHVLRCCFAGAVEAVLSRLKFTAGKSTD